MKLLVIVLLGFFGCAFGTTVQQCPGGRQIENLNEKVEVGACKNSPCRLRKGHKVPLTWKFTPSKDIKSLKNTVNANIVGVPFPFIGVDGSDACQYVYESDGTTKAPCPLKAGKDYVYKNTIDVLEIYPRLKLVVHWGLTTEDGSDVTCFEVPARITN